MGNCCYHLNKNSKALLCWRRGQCGASVQEYNTIARNIDALNSRIGKKTHSINWFSRFFTFFSLCVLQLLFLLSWYLVFFLYKRRRRGKYWHSAFLGCAVWIVLIGIAIGTKSKQQWYPLGVVHQDQVGLFAGPNDAYHVLHSLQAADEVRICEQQLQWYKVRIGNTTGWIPKDAVELV